MAAIAAVKSMLIRLNFNSASTWRPPTPQFVLPIPYIKMFLQRRKRRDPSPGYSKHTLMTFDRFSEKPALQTPWLQMVGETDAGKCAADAII
jgi:hypothetical protein